MKYALIGCGRISPNHIEAAKNNKLDFVAMCDIVPEIMQEKAEKFQWSTRWVWRMRFFLGIWAKRGCS